MPIWAWESEFCSPRNLWRCGVEQKRHSVQKKQCKTQMGSTPQAQPGELLGTRQKRGSWLSLFSGEKWQALRQQTSRQCSSENQVSGALKHPQPWLFHPHGRIPAPYQSGLFSTEEISLEDSLQGNQHVMGNKEGVHLKGETFQGLMTFLVHCWRL